MEALSFLMVVAVIMFSLMWSYRNRVKLGLWLKDSSSPSSIDPQARRKRLIRLVEDAQDEVARIDEEETTKS